jgi:hypothetical protein
MSYPMTNFISIGTYIGGSAGPVPVDPGFENRDFDFTSGVLDPRINFTRTSTATYFDSAGVLRTASVGAPRFDFDPVTLAPRGLLVEGVATNNYLWSQDITNAYWTKSAGATSAGATIAGIPFTRFTPDGSNGAHSVTRSLAMAAGSTVTLSWVAKADGYQRLSMRVAPGGVLLGRVIFDVLTGVITQNSTNIPSSITSLPGGAYRISVTFTMGVGITGAGANLEVATTSNGVTFIGDGVSGILLSAAQAENDVLTSIIPTTTTTVTRSADVASVPVSTWYRPDQGTLIAKSLQGTGRVASVYGAPTQYVAVSANGQGDISGSIIGTPAVGTMGLAYMAGDCAVAVNGSITGALNVPTLPINLTNLYIGSLDGTSQSLNGWVQSLSYKSVRLSNGDLINSTV